jgi:hypothetical protein
MEEMILKLPKGIDLNRFQIPPTFLNLNLFSN